MGLIGPLFWLVSVPAKRTDLLLQLGWYHGGPRASMPLPNYLPPQLRLWRLLLAGTRDSPNCQSLLFCMAMGFVLGLNSGSDCCTAPLQPPCQWIHSQRGTEGRLHLETGPSWSIVGLAVRLSKAAQQAAGPTAGDTARGRRLHPAASTPPHPGGSS